MYSIYYCKCVYSCMRNIVYLYILVYIYIYIKYINNMYCIWQIRFIFTSNHHLMLEFYFHHFLSNCISYVSSFFIFFSKGKKMNKRKNISDILYIINLNIFFFFMLLVCLLFIICLYKGFLRYTPFVFEPGPVFTSR